MQIDLSIIIVTFNSERVLFNCINSFLNNKYNSIIEVIIIDNSSTDNSIPLLKKKQKSNFILIENKKNEGYATAVNKAFQISKGRYIMCLNPDVILHPDAIKETVSFLDEKTEFGMAMCAEKDEFGNITLPFHKFPFIEPIRIFNIFKSKLKHKKTVKVNLEKHSVVNWVRGTGITVRRELLWPDAIFKTENFLFWEEYYLCKKIKEQGYKIALLPKAVLTHTRGESYKHDAVKLNIVRQLSIGVGYIARKKEFGVLIAQLNNIIGVIDHLILYIFFRTKLLLKYNNDLFLSVVNYKAQLIGYFNSLIGGQKFAVRINEKAKQVLNISLK